MEMSNTAEIVVVGVLVIMLIQVFLKWVIDPTRQLKKRWLIFCIPLYAMRM